MLKVITWPWQTTQVQQSRKILWLVFSYPSYSSFSDFSVTLHTLLQYMPPPHTKIFASFLVCNIFTLCIDILCLQQTWEVNQVWIQICHCAVTHIHYISMWMCLKQTLYSYTHWTAILWSVSLRSVSSLALVLLTSTEAIAMIYCMHNLKLLWSKRVQF